MDLHTKTMPALRLETKAASATARPIAIVPATAEGRSFKGYASTWDVDYSGDLIMRGAYADTLATWRASGRPIPLVDSHSYGSIFNVLGQMVDAKEDETGLFATFDVIDGPDGDRVLERVRSGAVQGLSIGYRVPRGGERAPSDQLRALGVKRILDRIGLHEVSLCLSPMNAAARVTSPNGKGLAPDDPRRVALREQLASLRARHAEHGIAPDDPRRIALGAKLRGLKLRALHLGISA